MTVDQHFRTFVAAIPLLIACLAGCGDSPSSTKGPEKGSTANGKPAEAAPLPELKGDVNLDVVSWDELKEKIAGHKGKVVVLDVWSSWCEPCLKAFPGLVTLQRKHPDDVVCMSLNLNYPGDPPSGPTDEQKEDALKFLKEKGAKFPNYLSKDSDEKVYELAGGISLPAVMVFDPEGNLSKTFQEDPKEYGKSGFTYEKHITPYVETLLTAPKP